MCYVSALSCVVLPSVFQDISSLDGPVRSTHFYTLLVCLGANICARFAPKVIEIARITALLPGRYEGTSTEQPEGREKKKKEHQLATRVWKPSTFHNNTSTRPSQNHATRGCHINRLSAVDRKLGGTRHHKETPGSRGHGVGSGGHRHRQKHKHRHRRRHRIKRPTWTPVKTQPRPLAKGMVN